MAVEGIGCTVVGLGASAGGLEAVQAFLRAVPPGSGLAVVIVFHHDPSARSLLPEVLLKHALLPVVEARDGMPLAADHVYTAPADQIVLVRAGRLCLAPIDSTPARRNPIDRTLMSIAEDVGARGAAVILSGVGSDGALGLKGISDAGGVTFVQDPSTAKYDGMPQSAIATGAADHVLPPEALATELLAYAAHVRAALGRGGDRNLRGQVEDVLPAVCDVLLQQRGHNFKHYKTSTLVRRVLRRVQVLRLASARDYLERLRSNASEAEQLFNDLLIGVTAFFRDPDAFATLAREALPKIFAGRPTEQPVRLWAAGCATGEEAYTLAMLVREHLDTVAAPATEVQIFATDIDEEALAFARQGVYPLGVADEIGPDRLKRFFIKKGQQYHVTREQRDLVLFSVHNVINDPPFSRLDLISCRNLLIYLGPHLQKKLIPLFHYALRPGGYLFLGPSENLSSHRELFRPVDAKHRLSQRLPTAIRSPGLITGRSGPLTAVRPPNVPPSTDNDTYLLMQRIVLDEFAPKAVVVNEEGQIVSASGNLEKYLTISAGAYHSTLTRLVRDSLRVGVRAALAEAGKVRRKVIHDRLSLRTDDGVQRVMVTVQPMPQMGDESGHFLVVFQDVGLPITKDVPEAAPPAEDAATLIEQLERELANTREELERTVQDLEAANEELKSGNEELLSMNEELQSANEELETSKEEVQAANDTLSRVNTDLENLLASTQIATLFLDKDGRLRMITPAAAAVYRVRPEDAGRPLTDFTHRAKAMPPLPSFAQVRDRARAIEDEVELDDGSHVIRRVLPYRDRDGSAEGVVVTFTDITERKRAEEARDRSNALLRAISEHSLDIVFAKDAAGGLLFVNPVVASYFGHPPSELLGKNEFFYIPDRAAAEAIRENDRRIMQTGQAETVEESIQFGDQRRTFISMKAPMRNGAGQVVGVVGISHDVTELKRAETAVRESEERFKTLADGSPVLLWVNGTDGCEFVNRAYLEFLGVESETDVRGYEWGAFIHPDDRQAYIQSYRDAFAAGAPFAAELRFRRHDGEWRWMRSEAMPRRDADGACIGYVGATTDVSERWRAEEALRASEERLALGVQVAGLAVAEVDYATDLSYLSAEAARMFGLGDQATAVPRTRVHATFHPADREELATRIARCLDPAGPGWFAMDHRVVWPDGQARWLRARKQVFFDGEAGARRPRRAILVALDVTGEKRTAEAVRANEQRLRLATAAANIGIWEWNVQTNRIRWDAQMFRIYGVEPTVDGVVPYTAWSLAVLPDELAQQEAILAETVRTGGQSARAFRIRRPDGEVRYIEAVETVRTNARGEAEWVVGTNIDVTERTRAEEQSARLAAIVSSSADAILSKTLDGVVTSWNEAAERLFGYAAAEMVGQPITRLFPPDRLAEEDDILIRLRRGERIEHYETVRVAKDGRRIDVSVSISPLRDVAGNVIGASKIVHDISERKRAAARLRQSEERYRATFDNAAVAIAHVGLDGRWLQFNDALCEITGYSRAELGRMTFEDVTHPDDIEADWDQARRLVAGEIPMYSMEKRYIRKNGRAVWVNLTVSLLRGPGGEAENFISVIEDISARKQAEEELRVQDKRKDEFLATLAHELRNPLAPIQNGLEILRMAGETRGPLIKARDMMDRQLQHMIRLVDDLLDITRVRSGKIVLRRERLDLREVIDGAVEACRPTVNAKRHALAVERPDGPVIVDGDRTRLTQTVANLLTNAAKYSEPEASIQLSLASNGSFAVIQVADTGVGIAPELIPTLWDMFTQVRDTLEKSQGGLGIGLSLVKRLVEMHGGTATAESPGVGQGSTFTIRLPLATATDDVAPEAGSAVASKPAAGRRVLVVDDNVDGAESLVMMLQLFGHTTAVAHSGPQAVAVAEAFKPEVVFCDIGLPGYDGYEVARRLRANPVTAAASLIALTGWGSEADRRKSHDSGFDGHLTKPVEADALQEVLAADV